jgi:hypothetical protein
MEKMNRTMEKEPTYEEIQSIHLEGARKGLLEDAEKEGMPEFWHVWDEETRQRHLDNVRTARILKREMARLKVNINDVSILVEPHRDFDDVLIEGYYLHKGESPLTVVLGYGLKPVKILVEITE